METMTNELTVIPRTIGMMGGMGMLKPEFIEDAGRAEGASEFY
jgi:hypothetical protein